MVTLVSLKARGAINRNTMKKSLIALTITCALALVAQAGDDTTNAAPGKAHAPSAETKALLAKYDTNKDGKLDKEEKAKMRTEDKEAWAKAHPKKKKAE